MNEFAILGFALGVGIVIAIFLMRRSLLPHAPPGLQQFLDRRGKAWNIWALIVLAAALIYWFLIKP